MPRGSSKAKFYGVARGREPGVYSTWDEASAQVTGIKGAVHKSFGTEAEAEAWVAAQRGGDPGGDPRPSESARLRSPATSPIPPRARPSSSARLGATSPPPARRAMSTNAGFADAENAAKDDPSTISTDKRYLLAFDGACRGNPGPSGAGALIKEITKIPAARESRDESRDESHLTDSGAVVYELASYLGDALTNNESEYLALIAGLRAASELGCADVEVIGDSKLVINQVSNVWQVKKPNLVPLWEEARAVIASAPFKNQISMTHVERERNAEADALANAAIELGRSRGLNVNVARGYVRPSRDETVTGTVTESVTETVTGTVAEPSRGFGGGGGRGKALDGGSFANGDAYGASSTRKRLARLDGFSSETFGGFASSRVASFARPVRLNAGNGFEFRGSVSPGRKRAFPSVSPVAPTASEGEAEGFAFGADAKASRRSAERVDRNGFGRPKESTESKSASQSPDPAMFASMTVSRMRRAEVNRLAPGLLRAARFFV